MISGFVIYLTATKPGTKVKPFIIRRIARIVPLYWFSTLLLVLCALVFPSAFRSLVVTGDTLLKSLLFIPHFNSSSPTAIWPLLVPGWSLNYEMFFYGVVALLLICSRDNVINSLTILFVALVLAGYALSPTSAVAITFTDVKLLLFPAGAWLGRLYVSGAMQGKLRLGLLTPAGFGMILATQPFFGSALGTSLELLGSIFVVAGALALEANSRVASSRTAVLLGDASYSIYLTHLFALGAFRLVWVKLGLPSSSLSVCIIYIVANGIAAAAMGVLVYRFIERPFLRFFRRSAPHHQPASPKSEAQPQIQ